MAQFKFDRTPIQDMFEITYFYSQDNRGGFGKIFHQSEFYFSALPDFEIRETLISISQPRVIRGLHFQDPPQAKLVSCIKGKIWDVGVDLRPDSPTYKQWYGTILSSENHKSLFIPKYFAHGYVSLEDSIVVYQCDEVFAKSTDSGINYLDPTINVKWPIDWEMTDSIVSDKDKSLPYFKDRREKI